MRTKTITVRFDTWLKLRDMRDTANVVQEGRVTYNDIVYAALEQLAMRDYANPMITGDDRNLIHEAGPFKALSLSDGTVRVEPEWQGYDGKPGYRRVTSEDDDESGGPGLLSRMACAQIVADILNNVMYAGTEGPVAGR